MRQSKTLGNFRKKELDFMNDHKSSAQNENNRLNELHKNMSEVLFSIEVIIIFKPLKFKYDLAKQKEKSRLSKAIIRA